MTGPGWRTTRTNPQHIFHHQQQLQQQSRKNMRSLIHVRKLRAIWLFGDPKKHTTETYQSYQSGPEWFHWPRRVIEDHVQGSAIGCLQVHTGWLNATYVLESTLFPFCLIPPRLFRPLWVTAGLASVQIGGADYISKKQHNYLQGWQRQQQFIFINEAGAIWVFFFSRFLEGTVSVCATVMMCGRWGLTWVEHGSEADLHQSLWRSGDVWSKWLDIFTVLSSQFISVFPYLIILTSSHDIDLWSVQGNWLCFSAVINPRINVLLGCIDTNLDGVTWCQRPNARQLMWVKIRCPKTLSANGRSHPRICFEVQLDSGYCDGIYFVPPIVDMIYIDV